MMYMGSKNRIAKHLLPIILKDRKPNQWYVEPFVGGANMIDKVDGNRIGNDSNEYLIAMWEAIQSGWIPPKNVSKDEYHNIKDNPELHPKELVSFVLFLCSFGGKWKGGYAKNNSGTNYAATGVRALVKQLPGVRDIIFTSNNYRDMSIPDNSIIYCDPPYQNTTSYKDGFNHSEFWQWCRDMTGMGHSLFVSEYSAPDDFECIFEVNRTSTMNKNEKQIHTEKLFIYGK